MKSIATLCLALAPLAPFAAAGVVTIDATKYMPVGQFDAWEMIDKAQWNEGLEGSVKAEPQILSIGKVQVIDGVVHYNVKSKLFGDVEDVVLQIGVDQGVLYLYGAQLIDPEADFDNGDITIPLVFFDQPVPLGDTTTNLDEDFASTPVTATVEVEIDVGPKDFDGAVDIAGTVTSRWNSVDPILTPLGLLGDVGSELAELQIDVSFTFSSEVEELNDALQGKVVAKGVRGVLGLDHGFVQIDGEGEQQKILNRAVLPGQLLSNPADADVFPDVPEGDLTGFAVGTLPIAVIDGLTAGAADGAITDGPLTLTDIHFDQTMYGALEMTAQVSSTVGPVDLQLDGNARMNPKTGGLKLKLSGKTKKLTDIVKPVVFSVTQEFLPLDGGEPLHLAWKAGKDPITKEPIGGVLDIPLAPFVAESASLVLNKLVDDPAIKKGLLSIGTTTRKLAAEGVLTLNAAVDGGAVEFPVYVLETVKVKEGLPATRSYKLCQTGHTRKVFGWGATSTNAADYLLTKFSGKLMGLKVLPEALADVEVSAE